MDNELKKKIILIQCTVTALISWAALMLPYILFHLSVKVFVDLGSTDISLTGLQLLKLALGGDLSSIGLGELASTLLYESRRILFFVLALVAEPLLLLLVSAVLHIKTLLSGHLNRMIAVPALFAFVVPFCGLFALRFDIANIINGSQASSISSLLGDSVEGSLGIQPGIGFTLILVIAFILFLEDMILLPFLFRNSAQWKRDSVLFGKSPIGKQGSMYMPKHDPGARLQRVVNNWENPVISEEIPVETSKKIQTEEPKEPRIEEKEQLPATRPPETEASTQPTERKRRYHPRSEKTAQKTKKGMFTAGLGKSSKSPKQPGLLLLDPSGKMQEINLNRYGKPSILLGSDNARVDIPLDAKDVSGIHGEFQIDNGNLYFADVNPDSNTYLMKQGSFAKLVKNESVGPLNEGTMFILGGDDAKKGMRQDAMLMIIINMEEGNSYKEFPVLAFSDGYTIGRAKDCDIVLKNPTVSKKHCHIGCTSGTLENGQTVSKYYIEDLNSRSGVFVNGQAVHGGQELFEKDVIQIAGSVMIFSSGRLICRSSTDGVQLTTRDLVKTVNHGKKQILSHVNFSIEQNEFVAIVGGSGAGKSTLLKTLGGYDKDFEGDVYYNGISLKRNYNTLKNIIGYVPQEDIVYENLTLKKMLYYAAKMKMPDSTSREEIDERIAEVLKLIELSEHQNTMIRDLSGGQKKRASIAVELLADPGVFFLDEPTSGLDPGTERKLMQVLNRLAKTQSKTIIMVTHTTQSLDLCDRVIFMGEHGTLAHMGTPEETKEFFGVDSFMEVYNLLDEDTKTWADKFAPMNKIEQMPEDGSTKISKPKRKSFLGQLWNLTKRYAELIINDLPRLFLLLVQPAIIAIFLRIVASDDVFVVYEPTHQILFTFSCSGIWIGIFNTIQEVCKERAILKREYMSNLRLSAYVLSKYAVQFVISAVQTWIFVGLFIILMGNVPEDGVMIHGYTELFITMWLTIYASSALGLFVSSVMKNGDRAMAISPFLLIIQLLFSGVLFSLSGISEVISWLTISRWSVESLGNVVSLNSLKHQYTEVEYAVNEMFRHGVEHLMQTWQILGLFILVLGIISMISLRSVSKDR